MMEKQSLWKSILKVIIKVIVVLIAVFNLFLSLSVLGKSGNVLTQIGTILYPFIYSWVLLSSLVITMGLVLFIVIRRKNIKIIKKWSIIAVIFSFIALLASCYEYANYKHVIEKNGAHTTVFSGFEAIGKMSEPDEKVIYSKKENEKLSISIYKPKKVKNTSKRPVYVYIHGGGWSSGDSESASNLHRMMADKGFVSFSINYRLATKDKSAWDKQIKDINDAMKYIQKNAHKYGGDTKHILLSGESAGGNLALIYAGRTSKGSLDGPKVSAVSALFPAIDLKWTSENAKYMTVKTIPNIVENYIGGSLEKHPERVKAVSPLNYINDQFPPTLIVHGEKDTMVTVDGSKAFDKALDKADIKHQLAVIPYNNHGTSTQVNFDLTMKFIEGMRGLNVDGSSIKNS